jgi:hypothetical protein
MEHRTSRSVVGITALYAVFNAFWEMDTLFPGTGSGKRPADKSSASL